MAGFLPASVRGQAVLATAVAMTFFGLAIGMAAYVLVSQTAHSSAQEVIATRVADVGEQLGDGFLGGGDSVDLGVGEQASPVLLQVMDLQGRVVAATPGLNPDTRLCPAAVPAARVEDSLQTDVGGRQTTFLRAVQPVATPDGTVAICAALSESGIERAQSAVLLSLLIVLPLVIGGVCLAVWLSVGRALRAVDDLRVQAEEMERTSAGALRVQPTGDEVERLGHTLSSLLDVLQQQSASTRQFVADAGHELRNPLATLRLSLEFGRDGSDDDLRDSVNEALADLDRLEELVQDLLVLARTDAMDRRTHFVPVDLAAVVLGAADGVRRARPDVDVVVDVAPCVVVGDETGLRSMVVNLADNAARHATRSVRMILSVTEDAIWLRVDDDGAGLRPEDCERVFDRFVRLDEARVRDAGGSGLGLAIVESVAVLHGGRAVARPGPGGHVEVTLPYGAASAGRPVEAAEDAAPRG
jgi:signal transduction histidine kinase